MLSDNQTSKTWLDGGFFLFFLSTLKCLQNFYIAGYSSTLSPLFTFDPKQHQKVTKLNGATELEKNVYRF